MASYTAMVAKGEEYWVIRVPEIGYATQARTIKELNTMTEDLISIMTEDKGIHIDYRYDLPPEVAESIELKRQAAELEARAMEAPQDGGVPTRHRVPARHQPSARPSAREGLTRRGLPAQTS